MEKWILRPTLDNVKAFGRINAGSIENLLIDASILDSPGVCGNTFTRLTALSNALTAMRLPTPLSYVGAVSM